MENCIGVTYTATQSTLELFKLEVNYSSTLSFHQKCKIEIIGVAYTATQSTLELFKLEVHQLCVSIKKIADCIGVTYTATQSHTGTI